MLTVDLLQRVAKHNWAKWDATHPGHHGWSGHADPTHGRQTGPSNPGHSASTIGLGGAASAAVKAIEQQIAHNKDESGHAIDPHTGQVLVKLTGQGQDAHHYGTIQISDEAAAAMKGRDLIFTHNHPSAVIENRPSGISNSLSKQDVYAAVMLGFKQMRAVSPGAVYTMNAPPGGWKPEHWPVIERAYATEMGHMQQVFEQGLSETIDKIPAGEPHTMDNPAVKSYIADMNASQAHDVWTRMANSTQVAQQLGSALNYHQFLTGDHPL